ncbi:plasmid mobilization relaxosome protein MobC [Ruminococcaceae bacterium OttesenSCG-928-L11]|nr:plasmid mobilization relaxosome protein MobC [Ruminococcaceae bacterium OttesenSCG-928-L11]
MSIQKSKRDIEIKIRISEAEKELIAEKMALANIRNREAYLRKMALDGYVVRLDLADVRRMCYLLDTVANNLNQIARRANETRSIYQSDIQDLREHYGHLMEQADEILRTLSKIKV